MNGIEQGSIIVDADLAMVADIRSCLEKEAGEAVCVSALLAELLKAEDIETYVAEYREKLWDLTDEEYIKYQGEEAEKDKEDVTE